MKIDFSKLDKLCSPGATAGTKSAATGALNKIQQERQQAFEVYRTYQENTRKAELIKASICKGVKCGTPPAELLPAAVECISLLTNDQAFLEQYETDAEIVQGLQSGGQKAVVEDMQHRLHLMKRCIENELESFSRAEKKNGRG